MSQVTYTALFERATDGSWSAHVPDLPTIVVGANTRSEAEVMVREAIELHLEDLKERGLPLPPPLTHASLVEVAA